MPCILSSPRASQSTPSTAGFIADPARVRHPKDKPKVERGVQYVRERLFKGGDFDDLPQLRTEAQGWSLETAGTRTHGATRWQPLAVFQDEERNALMPWDGEPCDITHWRTARVHPDHHAACQYALWPVPVSICPPSQAGKGPSASAPMRQLHRPRGLPRRTHRPHHESSGAHQAGRRPAGTGSVRIRRPL